MTHEIVSLKTSIILLLCGSKRSPSHTYRPWSYTQTHNQNTTTTEQPKNTSHSRQKQQAEIWNNLSQPGAALHQELIVVSDSHAFHHNNTAENNKCTMKAFDTLHLKNFTIFTITRWKLKTLLPKHDLHFQWQHSPCPQTKMDHLWATLGFVCESGILKITALRPVRTVFLGLCLWSPKSRTALIFPPEDTGQVKRRDKMHPCLRIRSGYPI